MASKPKSSPVRTHFKILIVDDEPGFRRTYSDLFQHFGHEVVEAEDGEKGLESANTGWPDLVLLDLVMPKLDGYGVLRQLRSNKATAKLPVIIFSVLGEQTDIQRALDMGANDYIIKGSYSPAEVMGKIGKFLAKSSIKGLN